MSAELSYPLSLVEARMLALNKQRPDADILNRPLKIFGDFCVDTFTESYKWLTKQYPILRTRYTQCENTRRYVKVLDSPAVISFQDYSAMDEDYIADKLKKLSSEVFNIEKDPLFIMYLIKCAEEEFILYIKCHHICSDGMTCVTMIKNTFQAYYAYKATGRFQELVPDYSLPEYVQFEKDFANTPKGLTSSGYWKKMLSHQKTADTIVNVPQSMQSHDVELNIYDNEYAAIKESIRRMNVSTFSYVLAGFQSLMPDDMLISTTVSTRIKKIHRQQYGAMFNYALISQGYDGEDFESRAQRLRKEIFKAQRTPYLCETIGMHGNADYAFDYTKTALSNYYKIDAETEGLAAMAFGSGDSSEPTPISADLSVKTLDAPMRSVPYSVYLSIGEFESKLNLKLIYNIDLFSEQEALRILHSLKTKLVSPSVLKCVEVA